MKKKFIKVIAFAAIAIAASYNYTQNKNVVELSDLALENIEALARGEGGGKCTGPKVLGACESRNTAPCSDLSGCQS
ncbi:MAG: hypothetical protein IJ430_02350 [Parabacteroides sp.]|nr:hypothetical protein [Parabacteroides sp.]